MKLVHTESRKGRRGHKWFPDNPLRQFSAASSFAAARAMVAAILLGARTRRRGRP